MQCPALCWCMSLLHLQLSMFPIVSSLITCVEWLYDNGVYLIEWDSSWMRSDTREEEWEGRSEGMAGRIQHWRDQELSAFQFWSQLSTPACKTYTCVSTYWTAPPQLHPATFMLHPKSLQHWHQCTNTHTHTHAHHSTAHYRLCVKVIDTHVSPGARAQTLGSVLEPVQCLFSPTIPFSLPHSRLHWPYDLCAQALLTIVDHVLMKYYISIIMIVVTATTFYYYYFCNFKYRCCSAVYLVKRNVSIVKFLM